jgi:hypothetical protein
MVRIVIIKWRINTLANYYAITIDSEKMKAKVAAKLLERIGEHNLIQNFSFHDGHMFSYTRGCPDIADILTEYNFTNEEVKIEDEFERFWNSLPPEEYEQICKEAQAETEAESEKPVLKKSTGEYSWEW